MEWLQAPVVQGLLWGAAILAAAWVLVPAVAFAIRPARFRTVLLADPAASEPWAHDPIYARAVHGFAEMGLRPAGRIVERAWFLSPAAWRFEVDGPVWMAPDGKILASMFYIPGSRRWITAAATLFADGGYLETVSFSPKLGLAVVSGDQRRVEIDTVEPTDLIAEHRRQVEDFAREREAPPKDATLREAVDGMMTFSRRNFPRAKLRTAAVCTYLLLGTFICLLLSALNPLRHYGWLSWLRPVAMCSAAAGFLATRWIITPSRVPALGRIMVMLVPLGALLYLGTWIERHQSAVLFEALDRLDADVVSGRTSESVDRTAGLGPTACGGAIRRYDDPQTAPETRRALHALLVRWNGTDLGEKASAWLSWCRGLWGLK